MPWDYINGKHIPLELDNYELAWSAGFFDGEGCCICVDRKNCNPELLVSITQKYNFVLRRFKKAVGSKGTIYTSTRDGYRFQTHTFEKSQAVMSMLWKYLSPIKKEQYKKAIKEYMELYNPNKSRDNNKSIGERRRQNGIDRRNKEIFSIQKEARPKLCIITGQY